MSFKGWKSIVIATTAVACLVPALASAQRNWDRDDRRFERFDIRDEVAHTFRDSKDFRHYFEHNFRASGHEPRWDATDRYGHPEHEGRYGQMTLKDAIQNMDEDIERLRAEVSHHGDSRAARDLAEEIQEHADQVDRRINRVGDWYRFNGDRDWRWDRSELFNRWNDLRSDIRRTTRDLLDRR